MRYFHLILVKIVMISLTFLRILTQLYLMLRSILCRCINYFNFVRKIASAFIMWMVKSLYNNLKKSKIMENECVSKVDDRVYVDALSLKDFIEVDFSISIFGRKVISWHFPPKKS